MAVESVDDNHTMAIIKSLAIIVGVVLLVGLSILVLYYLYKCTKLCESCFGTSSAARRLHEMDDLDMEAENGMRPTTTATSSAANGQYKGMSLTTITTSSATNGQYKEVPDDVMKHTTIERFVQEIAKEQAIRFTVEQLARYTNNYSAQLGAGGFGTVYKGALPNRLSVAVKLLHSGLDRKTSEEQFMAEMGTIGRTHHVNLVRLYGFCFDGRTATHALVYEFMPHGSLNAYLSSRGYGVSMATVAAIATGVARGLRYLHEECRPKILHLDIKPANVLLDGSLTPKVADFGLARLLNLADTHISVSSPRGTPGYAPPEMFLEGRVTDKCDVYSFGTLLLYIVHRGRKVEAQEWFAKVAWTRYEAGQLKELLVPTHGGADREELVERMCKVAFWCVQRQPPARPSMSEVVKMLEGEKKIDQPPNPFQYLDAQAPAANLWEAMERGLDTMPSAATGRT